MTMEDQVEIRKDAALLPRRRFVRVRVLALCFVIFVCGLVVGSLATRLSLREHRPFPPGSPSEMVDRITQRLRGELDLTDAQVEGVRGVFARNAGRVEDIQKQVDPQMQVVFADVETAVAQLLEPDQQSRWREVCVEMRSLRHHSGEVSGTDTAENPDAGSAPADTAGAVEK